MMVHLYLQQMSYIHYIFQFPQLWMTLFAILIIIEIMTLGLTTIWFAGGAMVAFIAALAGAPMWCQVLLFLAVSFVLLFMTRPWAVAYFNNSRSQTNLSQMEGKEGRVIEKIDNFQQTGRVKINGLEWSARANEDEEKIEVDSCVVVDQIQGVKVIVHKK
jgi:membrane protein implicated in regulation of membrane protease activity